MPGGLPESLRLWWLCENMKWSALPVAGGLYDQHPRLLSEFEFIFQIKAERQNKEHKKAEADARRTKGGSKGAGRGRGRRR